MQILAQTSCILFRAIDFYKKLDQESVSDMQVSRADRLESIS